MRQAMGKKEQASPRVLVIDPEENIIEFIRMGLRYEGYQVEGCQRGLQSLEMARRIQADLIILELALPDIDGLAICRQFCIDEAMSIVPIIALTSLKDVQTHLHIQEAGASTCLTKPFDFDTLLEQVRRLTLPLLVDGLRFSSVWDYELHDFLAKGLPPEWWSSHKGHLHD